MAQYSEAQLTVYVDQMRVQLQRMESQIATLAAKVGVVFEDPAAGLPPEVVEVVRAGNRLGAINAWRKATGGSVEEGRAAIAAIG